MGVKKPSDQKSRKKKFYITTAIDYTNDIIHIGHSYQKILADALARYHRLIGDETYFLTGTDEHGQKVEKSAKEEGIDPKKFVDRIAKADRVEWDGLKISYDRFIRTTDSDHVKFAQEFYLKVKSRGDIYLGKYQGLYCEGCEAYCEEPDLVKGKCPFHPNKDLIKISEENYFFRLSKYQKFLEEYIESHKKFIIPQARRKEVLNFIKRGLKDFSVSRQGVSWGIPVPDDPKQTIYVWFDALINYLTFGVERGCWPADIHVLGKDNLKFHAIYWPAMLKSAGYNLPKTILVHDFISLNGQKISKSLGNIIRPSELIKKFGVDGVRYYFLRFGPLTNDIDITLEKIKKVYNADLANGLGNLIARVIGLTKETKYQLPPTKEISFSKEVKKHLKNYRPDEALAYIWQRIKRADTFINQRGIWNLKDGERKAALANLVRRVRQIAYDLQPFLPETSEKILKAFSGTIIHTTKPLFPRLQ